MRADNISDKFEIEPKSIGIGGKKLELLTVANLDPFLAEIEAKGDDALSSFPFWVKIWEAAIVLTDHLVHQDLDPSLSVLEVGAGMGVTGLFLGAFGHPVTVTDYNDDALALLEKNIDHNGLTSVKVEKLDWHNPEIEGKFDIVCGAELIYKESDVAPVINLVKTYLKPGGTVYVAHDIRRMSMIEFLKAAETDFDIQHAGKSFTGKDQKLKIVLHTLQLKA